MTLKMLLFALILSFPATLTAKPTSETQSDTQAEQEHRLVPGDLLAIYVESFMDIPDKSVPVVIQPPAESNLPPVRGYVFTVRYDGTILLPRLMGAAIKVEGLTSVEARSLIHRAYVEITKILGPEATITVSWIPPDSQQEQDKTLVSRVYSLGDLAGSGMADSFCGTGMVHAHEEMLAIINDIRTKVAQETWNEEVTIELLGDYLDFVLIKQTKAAHLEISTWLDETRKFRKMGHSLRFGETGESF